MDYTLDGSLSLGGQYFSNILLADRANSEWGLMVNLAAALTAAAENWGYSGKLRLENFFYTPDSNINRQNQYLDLAGYFSTERSRFELMGNFIDDYLLAYENPTITGNVLGKVHRMLKGLGPSWTYFLSERTQATVGYTYMRSDFDFSIPNFYPNSNNHSVLGRLAHKFTEQLTLLSDLSFTAYIADSTLSNETIGNVPVQVYSSARPIDYFNFSLGGNYAYDSTLDFQFMVGGQYSYTGSYYNRITAVNYRLVSLDPPRYEPVTVQIFRKFPTQDSLGPVFQIGLTKQFDVDRINVSYARQIMPSINGFLLAMDRVGLTASHQFLPDFIGSLVLGYTHQTYPNSINGQPGFFSSAASYYSASAELSYHWTENWMTSLSYGFVMRDWDTQIGPNANNQQAFITVMYSFDPYKF